MVLVPALPDFCSRYPDIELEVGLGNRDVDLVAENVDCTIRAGAVSEQDLIARRIGEFRFVACASPAYLQAHGRPAAPADLRGGHRTIGMISARTGRAIPFMFSKDGRDLHLGGPHRLLFNDTNACVAAALAGLGIVQAPAFVVQSALDQGTLVPLLEDWRTALIPVHVVYAPNRYLSTKVRVFIDWVVELFDRTSGLRRAPAEPPHDPA
jgi:DNA-binding transcriptional LysR family regulator